MGGGHTGPTHRRALPKLLKTFCSWKLALLLFAAIAAMLATGFLTADTPEVSSAELSPGHRLLAEFHSQPGYNRKYDHLRQRLPSHPSWYPHPYSHRDHRRRRLPHSISVVRIDPRCPIVYDGWVTIIVTLDNPILGKIAEFFGLKSRGRKTWGRWYLFLQKNGMVSYYDYKVTTLTITPKGSFRCQTITKISK